MTDDPQDSKKLEILPVSGQADLPATQQRAFSGVVPNLPHENESDFIILRREFEAELTGNGLRFGHYIAHEAAVSRWHIRRYDQAMIASLSDSPSSRHGSAQQGFGQKALSWDKFRARLVSLGRPEKEIEVYRKDLDPSYQRSSPDKALALEFLVDIETRRYDENVDLIMQLNHSQHFLQTMAQSVADISAKEKQ